MLFEEPEAALTQGNGRNAEPRDNSVKLNPSLWIEDKIARFVADEADHMGRLAVSLSKGAAGQGTSFTCCSRPLSRGGLKPLMIVASSKESEDFKTARGSRGPVQR